MLFSKNGAIKEAVETDTPGSRMSFGFSREQVLEEYNKSKLEGLALIGTASGVIYKLSHDESKLWNKNLSFLYDKKVLPSPKSLRLEDPIGHQESMVELLVVLV